MEMDALSVRQLQKSFGDLKAVNNLSFDIPEGIFFAFLGPNGAGKSTTISIITSLLRPDSGEVRVFGRSPSDPETKKNIGVVFQDPKMDKTLTVRENLEIRASLYGLYGEELKDAVRKALDTTGCVEFADRKYGELSGGQRRRSDIARALIHDPKLLILDEPTTGLDPKTRSLIWNLITGLNKERGITVLLTTHYMEEASGADRIVVINRGSIVADGTPSELRDRYCSDKLIFVPGDMEEAESRLKGMGIQYTKENKKIVVLLEKTADSVPIIREMGDCMESVEVRSGTLDEAFINITGEELQ